MRQVKPIEERFWPKVLRGSDDCCWLWAGAKDRKGYGRIHRLVGGRRKTAKAHRVAYELAFGPIPTGLEILHSCDKPMCVNPHHLSVGTRTDNMLDAAAKGRVNPIGRGVHTHCPKGHPFSGENLYLDKRGHRHCRECTRQKQRERHQAKNPLCVPRGPRRELSAERGAAA